MLLETILTRLEEKGQSTLHRCVAGKLLELGAELPAWLIASYKKVCATDPPGSGRKGGSLFSHMVPVRPSIWKQITKS